MLMVLKDLYPFVIKRLWRSEKVSCRSDVENEDGALRSERRKELKRDIERRGERKNVDTRIIWIKARGNLLVVWIEIEVVVIYTMLYWDVCTKEAFFIYVDKSITCRNTKHVPVFSRHLQNTNRLIFSRIFYL